MRVVIPQRLWIGNHRDLGEIRGVLSLGISAVIDLGIEEQPIVFPREIIVCRFPLLDGAGNSPTILRAAIQTAITLVTGSTATLIGCSAGQSRSPCLAATVFSHMERIPPDDALLRILSAGPHDVSPGLWADMKSLLPQISDHGTSQSR